jgi:uncharacterized protein (DUF1697 family)
MRTWVALLRGVNVGGANILPMKDLRDLVLGLGHLEVRTYIQSGNCVFRSGAGDATAIGMGIGRAVERRFGFYPSVMVLSAEALDQAIAGNPYSQGRDDPGKVHLYFLSEPALGVDLEALEALRRDDEAFWACRRRHATCAPPSASPVWRKRPAREAEPCSSRNAPACRFGATRRTAIMRHRPARRSKPESSRECWGQRSS